QRAGAGSVVGPLERAVPRGGIAKRAARAESVAAGRDPSGSARKRGTVGERDLDRGARCELEMGIAPAPATGAPRLAVPGARVGAGRFRSRLRLTLRDAVEVGARLARPRARRRSRPRRGRAAVELEPAGARAVVDELDAPRSVGRWARGRAGFLDRTSFGRR